MTVPAIGLRVRFRDPDKPESVVTAQFATVRGHREMKDALDKCARLDVAENIAIRRQILASVRLQEAATEEELTAAGEAYAAAVAAKDAASLALIDATREFVEAGFRLAGASDEQVEYLASCVALEDLADLKAKAMFGAGVLDFTARGDRT
jgi:hypothetical protein